MKKLLASLAAFVLLAPACIGGGTEQRTVFVDYSHDQFASFVAANFPREVTVHPGTELVFRQTWTGEPHTVTGGTMAGELMDKVEPFIEKAMRGEEIPEEPPKDIMKLEKAMPNSGLYEEDGEGEFNQTAAQPCYLATGKPSTKGKPCKTKEQPEFTGKQTYYNSGIIPYEGPEGNEYKVKLAKDIKPGPYWFYCNVHGEFQSTKVVVKPASEKVGSTDTVSKRARKEIKQATDPIYAAYRRARRTQQVQLEPDDKESIVRGKFAGLFAPDSDHWHSINEFLPKKITAKAGEPITWNVLGFHTISFGVPKYFPIITFAKNGTVKRNPKLDTPAGGAKKYVEPRSEGPPEESPPVDFDGGTYDGSGFWSSGTLVASSYVRYTMRVSRAGTYKYACLVHPPMVGTLTVTR
jgi:plastocyanin